MVTSWFTMLRFNPLFVRTHLPTTYHLFEAFQIRGVSIPSSSGLIFQLGLISSPSQGQSLVSIPSSSGLIFQLWKLHRMTAKPLAFQSPLHQDSSSNLEEIMFLLFLCVKGFNPFFIRTHLPTLVDLTRDERNKIFVSIPSSSGLMFQLISTCGGWSSPTSFNPFFIRTYLPTFTSPAEWAYESAFQSLLHQDSSSKYEMTSARKSYSLCFNSFFVRTHLPISERWAVSSQNRSVSLLRLGSPSDSKIMLS